MQELEIEPDVNQIKKKQVDQHLQIFSQITIDIQLRSKQNFSHKYYNTNVSLHLHFSQLIICPINFS